jgi:DNA-binding MarR family transcriptional regulator
MNPSKKEMEMDVLGKFRLIFGATKVHFREVETACGISSAQLWILKVIQDNPGIGITDLAKIIAIHQTTASILVEKLSKKKLVEKRRSQEDQRRVGLFNLQASVEILNKAPKAVEGLLPSTLEKMNAQQLKQLNLSLNELVNHFDQEYSELANIPLGNI